MKIPLLVASIRLVQVDDTEALLAQLRPQKDLSRLAVLSHTGAFAIAIKTNPNLKLRNLEKVGGITVLLSS